MSAAPTRSVFPVGSICLVAFASVWGAMPSSVAADDQFYVMRCGKKIRLNRSESEYGVVLRHCDDAKACAQRLKAADVGTLEDFEHMPLSRVKMLKGNRAVVKHRLRAQQDPAVAEIHPIYRFEGSSTPVVGTGSAVAKLRPSVADRDRTELWKEYGVASAEPLPGQGNVFLLKPFTEDEDVALAERLAADRRVLWAQPNFRRPARTNQVTPVDPFYSRQWHLNNIGQLGGTAGADIDAPEAWEIATGEGVLFGIFDHGCDVDHEDLRDNYAGFGQDAELVAGTEGSDDPRPKNIGEFHSTNVMGLAAAAGNSLGGRGVAFGATFTASRGLGQFLSDVEVARAYNFAREAGVDVHINSWGYNNVPNPEVIVDIIQLAFREGRNKGDLDGDGDDDPLGMVILFASGNDGVELDPGFELSTIPEVIGVGGTEDNDILACYSNFGSTIDILAPTVGCELDSPGILTTDNTDSPEVIEPGLNAGGFLAGTNVRDADTAGRYTQFFSGTSASCPIAAGVAGLILSVNPMLTATDVRLILEHTAEKVSPEDAEYDGITGRSLRYAHGRINAGGAADKIGAVEIAEQTLTNGGVTWPDRPADVRVEGVFLRWRHNFGSDSFLVVAANEPFDFIPQDGACYDEDQENCTELLQLPGGVEVVGVGCGLSCDASVPGECAIGADQCVSVAAPEAGQTKYFAIYARNNLGRYSWGVYADSTGLVRDAGTVVGEESGGGTGGPPPPQGPSVTISVSPLEGKSPLTVRFSGNAVSATPIDESRTVWDFNVDDGVIVDATTRNATHTYVVPEPIVKTFIARLTMYDIDGNAGFAEVGIRVEGEASDDEEPPPQSTDIRIIVSLAGTPGSDVDEGTSPFAVSLSLEAPNLQGTLQGVSWDLGDGTRASSLVVPHTYVNEGDTPLRIPITATATATTSGGSTITATTTRIITVNPGPPIVDPGDPDLPGTDPRGEGGAATPCSGVGMIPLLGLVFGLSLLRSWRLVPRGRATEENCDHAA